MCYLDGQEDPCKGTSNAPVNHSMAVQVCKWFDEILRPMGYYVALTGGSLTKEDYRKDVDIVVYRNRQMHESFEMEDITPYLRSIGVSDIQYFGFVTKCKIKGISVDLFNPETVETDNY